MLLIETFFTAFTSVLVSFFASTTTSFILCWVKNIPFVYPDKGRIMLAQSPNGSFLCNNNSTPNITNNVCTNSNNDSKEEEKKEEKMIQKDPTSIYVLLCGNSLCLTYLLRTKSLNIEEPLHLIYSPLRFLFYLLWIEGVFYVVHRFLHTPPFYSWIHKKHHENYHIYPADAFYLSPIETGIIVLNQNIPFLTIPFTFQEYLLIQYFYFVIEYLSHTSAFFDHHVFHHKYYKWNYCVCFPIFDWIFQTYKECPRNRV